MQPLAANGDKGWHLLQPRMGAGLRVLWHCLDLGDRCWALGGKGQRGSCSPNWGGIREMGSTGTACLLQTQAGSSREIFSNNLILCRVRFGD